MSKPRNSIEILLLLVFLAAVFCLCVLGIGTLFHWPPSSMVIAGVAPGSSADWAGWVQAIGSIVAIIFSYRLGSKQANDARAHSWEVLVAQRAARESGLKAVVNQVSIEAMSIILLARSGNIQNFSDAWDSSQNAATLAALAAFDNAPLYELGSAERVRLAFSIRELAEHMRKLAMQCVTDDDRAIHQFALLAAQYVKHNDQCTCLQEEFDRLFSGKDRL